jgi:hypothetical protein
MAAGLFIRLAIVPFLYTEWLDPFVREHWAFGRVARSLVLGQGYGNTFADTGALSELNQALDPGSRQIYPLLPRS